MNNNSLLLNSVIQFGLGLMRQPNLSEFQFQAWLSNSINVLSQITNNPMIMNNYLTVVATANNNRSPVNRLSICLRYLIGIQSIV